MIFQGDLKKMNEYWMKQTRLFVLTGNGEIKYYKNSTLHRGTIIMDNTTKVTKTSKSSFEIITSSRTWYLYTVKNNIDKWIDSIEQVVSSLVR